MQEFTTPGAVDVPPGDNVVTALLANGERSPERPALAYRAADRFVDVSTAQLITTVRELAAGLISLGIEPGSRVCLFMPARIEFTYFDYAIWAAGCATVTIYETSSPDQVEWIVGNSGAVAVICGSDEQRKVFDSVADKLPQAKHVFTVDAGAVAELTKLGHQIPQSEVDTRIEAISHDDLGTLVYTSGTTGRPKGCALTHGNLIWDARQAAAALRRGARRRQLDARLPPAGPHPRPGGAGGLRDRRGAHRVRQQLRPPGAGDAGLQAHVHRGRAPRLREGLRRRPERRQQGRQEADLRAGDLGGHRATRKQAQGWSEGSAAARRPSTRVLDRLVYGKLRGAFGGRLRFALSGGAPLGERLGHFFDGARRADHGGVRAHRDDGGRHRQHPDNVRIGSVGRPVPGASARIAEDGEVLLKGGHIFRGYWENDEATAEVLGDDGWFATGDIGRDRRRRLPAHHRAQEGPHRHGRRQERGPRGAGGPGALRPHHQPVRGGGRRQALHRLPGHARRGGAPGLRRPARPGLDGRRRGPAGRRARRSRMPSTTPTKPCRTPRPSRRSASCPATSSSRAAS